jgi:hypothetical protein
VLTVIGNVVPSPLVKVIVLDTTEAVTNAFGVNEAVAALIAFDIEPLKKDAVAANEADVANNAFEIEPLKYEAVTALNAQLAVPNNDPVTLPLKDPVILPLNIKDPVTVWISVNAFPIFIPVEDITNSSGPPKFTPKEPVTDKLPDNEVEPVTIRLPVIIAEPVNGNDAPPPPPLPVLTVIGNVVPSPLVKVIVLEETDAVIRAFGVNEAVAANEAEVAFIALAIEPLKNEAVAANEADIACEALIANEAVNVFIILPDTVIEPDISTEPVIV